MNSTPDPIPSILEDPDRFAEAARYCFACGAENAMGLHLDIDYRDEVHRAETTLTLQPERQGWSGVAHGGVVSTILDEVLSWSLGQDVPFFTAELTIRYHRVVPIGVPLRAWGQRTRRRGRYMEAEGAIMDLDGNTLATAVAKFLSPARSASRAASEEDRATIADAGGNG